MAQVKRVSVVIINGFLESGKTTFIKDAILDNPKMSDEKILVICCEEGEEEFESLLPNVALHVIEEKEDLTAELLSQLNSEHEPTYVIIEYNGVWGMQTLYNLTTPRGWVLVDQYTIIDSTTFASYFSNMKSIFADMLRSSTTVILNRCTREDDFRFYRNNIKPCALQADLMYVSDEDGILDITLEEDLPYSLNDDVIVLDEESYTVWYIDMLDNIERYIGKTVEFIAQVAKPDYFRNGYFLAGNTVVTCCEDDMQFLGFVCKFGKTKSLIEGDFVTVRAEVHHEYSPEYEEDGPVLYVKTVSVANIEN